MRQDCNRCTAPQLRFVGGRVQGAWRCSWRPRNAVHPLRRRGDRRFSGMRTQDGEKLPARAIRARVSRARYSKAQARPRPMSPPATLAPWRARAPHYPATSMAPTMRLACGNGGLAVSDLDRRRAVTLGLACGRQGGLGAKATHHELHSRRQLWLVKRRTPSPMCQVGALPTLYNTMCGTSPASS